MKRIFSKNQVAPVGSERGSHSAVQASPTSPSRRPTVGKSLTRVQQYTTIFGQTQVPGQRGTTFNEVSVTVSLNTQRQHILSWSFPISLPSEGPNDPPAEMLDVGFCNLYTFPKVQFTAKPSTPKNGGGRDGNVRTADPTRTLGGGLLRTLTRVILGLAMDRTKSFLEQSDGSGACPIHALLLANTEPALEIAMALLEKRPKLLLQAHRGQPFEGENTLHVLIVNRREAAVVKMIGLAFAHLNHAELQELFRAQTSGVFFTEAPMLYYGGTPVAYATAFSLEDALTAMVVESDEYSRRHAKHHYDNIITFNDVCCGQTGLYPLHVAVANGLASMYNFLVDLPTLGIEYDHIRAIPNKRAGVGRGAPGLAGLTPLQTAAKLGDQRMVQYILRCNSEVNWVWGPVSELHLSLAGIDSLGDNNNDMMELIAQIGASERTRSMLLDSFMQGFIHKLFLQKWNLFGRHIHYVMRTLDLIYVALLAWLAMHMKNSPHSVSYVSHPLAIILSILPIAEEDIRSTLLWWGSYRGEFTQFKSRRAAAGVGSRLDPIRFQIWQAPPARSLI